MPNGYQVDWPLVVEYLSERIEEVKATTISCLQHKAYNTSYGKGWHDGPTRNVGESIALMHSELSEALEEARAGRAADEIYYNVVPVDGEPYTLTLSAGETPEPTVKLEGVPIELADCVIRILDFCGAHGIDLERAILLKMAYNETRPHRHGGKKF